MSADLHLHKYITHFFITHSEIQELITSHVLPMPETLHHVATLQSDLQTALPLERVQPAVYGFKDLISEKQKIREAKHINGLLKLLYHEITDLCFCRCYPSGPQQDCTTSIKGLNFPLGGCMNKVAIEVCQSYSFSK